MDFMPTGSAARRARSTSDSIVRSARPNFRRRGSAGSYAAAHLGRIPFILLNCVFGASRPSRLDRNSRHPPALQLLSQSL